MGLFGVQACAKGAARMGTEGPREEEKNKEGKKQLLLFNKTMIYS